MLISCAPTPANNHTAYKTMTCGELNTEIQKLSTDVAKRNNTSETSRVVDTGTTVAAQGASIAGVPYIGAVFSIGKTLMNHNKKTSTIKAGQAQDRLIKLQDIAYEKNCPYTKLH